jgi:hypothetical protein
MVAQYMSHTVIDMSTLPVQNPNILWLRILADDAISQEYMERALLPYLEADPVAWEVKRSQWGHVDGAGALIVRLGNNSKRSGLVQVCKDIGNVPLNGQGWISFGDSWNDPPMLEWSEHSVVPSNAKNKDAVRAAKEVHSKTNDADFVAEVLERVLSGAPQNLRDAASIGQLVSQPKQVGRSNL